MTVSGKIANVVLAGVLLLSTIGITLNKHYCMGRLKSVAVYAHADSCTGSDEKDPMPCCQDVLQVLQVDDMAKAAFEFHLDATVEFLAVPLYALSPISTESRTFHHVNTYAPPLQESDILILHHIFRI